MTKELLITRDIILHQCDLADEGIDMSHTPRRVAFIIVFAVSALTQNWQAALIMGLIAWIGLSFLFTPKNVDSLKGTNLASWCGLLGVFVRWAIAGSSFILIWFMTRATGWDGWLMLFGVFLLDLFVALFIESRQYSVINKERELLKGLPSVFDANSIRPYLHLMPLTAARMPKSPRDQLANLAADASTPLDSKPTWVRKFTQMPVDEVWTTFSTEEVHLLPDGPCVYVVFDENNTVYSVGNSLYRGYLGDWKQVLTATAKGRAIEVRVAMMNEADDLNAASYWLDKRLKGMFSQYDLMAIPEYQKSRAGVALISKKGSANSDSL